MTRTPLGTVLRHIHALAGTAAARRLTDLHLLHRFVGARDEDAFAELMRRHGPLVWSVCRRFLRHEQDAEDAFQAAFLVLARKAGAIRKGESVGSFLYGVAYRIAMKERGRLAQRRRREQQVGQPTPSGPVYEAAFRELQMLLDEGLNRLPEKYRTPFVLCCLEGKSKSEAARELGWKEGTVSSRLAHARKELQQFLSRKGVALAAVLTAASITESTGSACVPPVLAASALRAAGLFASGSSAAMKATKAVQLADAMLRNMGALPWKPAMTLLMVVSLAVGGAGMAYHAETTKQTPANESPNAAASAEQKPAREQEKPRMDRYGDPLPEGALARLGTIRFRQGFFIRQVAFSPDGKIVACAGAGRGVCLWDVATGSVLQQIGGATHASFVAFSPDGKKLACVFDVGKGGTGVYETDTGQKRIDLPDGFGSYPIGLAYAPDGKTIAGGDSKTNKVQFFDAATGEKRKFEISTTNPDEICRLTWSPDSKKLAWIGKSGSVHLWDAIDEKEVSQWKAHDKDVCSIAFSPDGKMLATGSADEMVCLWDIATQKKKHTLGGKHQQVRSIIFSRDGRMLASGHNGGTIALWDAAKGEEIRRWQAHAFSVCTLDFAPDGKTLVSGAFWESGPRLWDVTTGAEVRPFAGHTASVERVMFSQDGKHILSLGRDKNILDWNLTMGRESLAFKLPFHTAHQGYDHYTLSPRRNLAASWGYDDDSIRLWDTATGKECAALGEHKNNNRESGFHAALEFSPDGRLLAVGTKEGEVSVWDVAAAPPRRRRLERFVGPILFGPILCVAFSRDGQKIAAGSFRNDSFTIRIWDVATEKRLAYFSSTKRVDRLALSPDGKMLASASSVEGNLHLWDATTGRHIHHMAAAPPLYDVAFSPDGNWLAGAGADKDQQVHVWEVNTGLEVRSFRGHNGGGVLSVAFAPDGRTLASGGGDSSILLWDFTGRMKDGHLQTVKWTPRELEKRWIDLGSSAGPQAVEALWDLVASPEQTVPLLRQCIKPIEPADAERVERLVRDLDSTDFQKRAQATETLEKIVDGAEPVLRKKLTEKPSLEMRQRINQVLSTLEPSVSANRLRALRAIQVLEYVGTADAREHLRVLAKGIPNARLTREAKAALEQFAEPRP